MNDVRSIIALWNRANTGKTETLRELANLLLMTFPNAQPVGPNAALIVPAEGDFRLIIEVNGIRIAVETQGDPGTGLGGRLLDLVDRWQVSVIFCATRTRGDTVAAVEGLQANRGFEAVWTSTYQTDRDRALANRLKARHLVELVQALRII